MLEFAISILYTVLEICSTLAIDNPLEAIPFNSKSELSTFKTYSLNVTINHQSPAPESTEILLIIGLEMS